MSVSAYFGTHTVGRFCANRSWRRPAVHELVCLLVPIGLFAVYAYSHPPQKDAGRGWSDVLLAMCDLNISSELVQRQLACLLVLNFAWLLTASVVVIGGGMTAVDAAVRVQEEI